jgi:hypothetical protein
MALFIKLSGTEGTAHGLEGDNVILTSDNGCGQMVSPDDDDKMTELWLKR